MGEKPGYGRPRSWREGDTTPEAQARREKQARRKKLYWVTALLLALIGVFFALTRLFSPPADVRFFPLTVTQYSNIPDGYGKYSGLNPLTELDRRALSDVPWDSKNPLMGAPKIENPFSAQYERTWFEARMRDLKNDNEAQPHPVVVYVNAYARMMNGKLVLLTSDSLTTQSDQGIPFGAFLNQLKTVGQDKPEVKKLVLLDVMRPLHDGRRGVFNADVAAAVAEELKAVPDPQRAVLAACAPGQRSLMAEELGRSAFAYYVEQGLHGYADGWDSKDSEKDRVSVRELANYVRFHVERWAKDCRGAVQTPVFFPPDENFDFTLTVTLESQRKAMLAAGAGQAQPIHRWEDVFLVVANSQPELHGSYPVRWWAMHDDWLRKRIYEHAPEAMAYLQVHLLDIELRWRNGEPLAELDRDNTTHLKRAQTLLDRSQSELRRLNDVRSGTTTLVGLLRLELEDQLTAQEPTVQAERRKTIDGWLTGLRREAADFDTLLADERAITKKAEEDPKRYQEKAKAVFAKLVPNDKKPEFEKIGVKVYPDFLLAGWQALLGEGTPTPNRLRLYRAILELEAVRDAMPVEVSNRTREYAETAFLSRVLRLQGLESDELQEVLRLGLEVLDTGEQALAGDPGTLIWLQRPLHEAVRQRQQAEVLLFSPGYVPVWRAKAMFEQARDSYKELNRQQEVLSRARQKANESLAYLPYYVNYLLALPGRQREARIEAAIHAIALTADLQQQLMPPENAAALAGDVLTDRIARIRALYLELDDSLKRLREPLENRIVAGRPAENLSRLLGTLRDNRNQAGYLETTALLELPFYPIADRKAIWDTRQQIMSALRKQTLEADGQSQAREVTAVGGEDSDVKARSLAAARLGLEMLRLAPKTEWFTAAQAEVGKPLNDARREEDWSKLIPLFQQMGTALRGQWAEVERAKPENDFAADWLSRLRYAGKNAYNEPAELLSVRLRQNELNHMRLSLSQIYEYLYLDWENWKGDLEAARLSRAYKNEFTGLQQSVRVGSALMQDRPTLVFEKGQARQVPLRPQIANGKQVAMDVILDERALEGRVSGEELAIGPRSADVAVPPKGFLLRVTVDGWPYHFHWGVDFPAAALRRPELRFAFSRTEEPDLLSTSSLDLPAIPDQPLYLYVRNPTPQPRRVTVKVLYGGDLVCKSLPVELPANEQRGVPVKFKDKPSREVKWDSAAQVQQKLVFELYEGEGSAERQIEQTTVRVEPRIAEPSSYIRLETPFFRPPKDGKPASLELRFRPTRPLARKCEIRVELPPERNRGLDFGLDRTYATSQSIEPESRSEAALVIEDLKIDNWDAPLEAHVHVDGYKRAFIVVFPEPSRTESVTGRQLKDKRGRLVGGGRFLASDKPYAVTLEIDNLKDYEQIEATFDAREDGRFGDKSYLHGGRRATIAMTVNQDEDVLQFAGTAEDHKLEKKLDLASGSQFLIVKLVDRDRRPLTFFGLEPVEIRIDRTDPVLGDFKADLPTKNSRELAIRMRASDPESDIQEIQLWRGEFGPDGKPPPGKPTPATREQPGSDVWVARFPVNSSDRDVPLTVQVVNQAGRAKREFHSVPVGAMRDKPEAAVPAEVEIKVVIGTGDGLPAGGAPVAVFQVDEATKKPKLIDSKKTSGNGLVQFTDLAPGSYIFVAEHSNVRGKFRGEQPIVLKPGDNGISKVVVVKS